MGNNENDRDPVMPDALRDLLLSKKQTVAVAESVTAGHLQDKQIIRDTITVEESSPGEVRRFYVKNILEHFLSVFSLSN